MKDRVSATSAQSPLRRFIDAPTGRGGRIGRVNFDVRPRPHVELPHVDQLLAGAVTVDITPPPGLPKAGYSANANHGNGFHTRLRAAVTHLRAGRSSIALVQLDLLGGSPIVQHLVAEAVADRTDIPLAGIWLGATHTHAGPGQFLGSDFYNHHASNKPGFDPAWTQFLVDRIASAIIEAHDTRGPAVAGVGTTEVWGLTRNRSHDPYVHNRTVTDKRSDPQRKWVAVNPELHLLRVDRLIEPSEPDDGAAPRTEPLAAAVVFSIHGTGISQKAKEYNADLWAYLKGELGHLISGTTGATPVIGAMEGTHADVAPALFPGLAGHREARRIGTAVGAEAFGLYESLADQLSADVALDAGFREVDFDIAANRRIDGIELPDRPAVGAALVAGATENVTPVLHRLPPFKAGMPKRWGTNNPQGEKWVIGSRWLQPTVLHKSGFPRVLPVQVLRVGDTVLFGHPFETTVESGRRIAEAVADAASSATGGETVSRVIVASVVNDYWGYVATAEEYSRQFYEGGHTLYGPETQRFAAAQAAALVGSTIGAGVFADVVDRRSWRLQGRRFLPDASVVEVGRAFERKARFSDPTATVDGYWEQTWLDVAPGGLDWHDPLVVVECSDNDGATWRRAFDRGRPVDDQGWALAVSHLGPADDEPRATAGSHRYRVRWFNPVPRGGRRHRFVLLANSTREEAVGDGFD